VPTTTITDHAESIIIISIMTDSSSNTFTERLHALRAQWAERPPQAPPLSEEAKRACLAELEEVCAALGSMRDDLRTAAEREAAEREAAEAALTERELIPTLVARVATADDAMRALGARVRGGVGHFPELWVGRIAYLAQVQAYTKVIDCFHGQLGAFSSVPMEQVQVDPNGTREQQRLQQQQMQQQCQMQQLEQKLEQHQQWLNGYLYSRAPYDAATLDPQLKALNAEKAALVCRLRLLECEGHAVPGLSKLLQLL
jgi:hypothetical protein